MRSGLLISQLLPLLLSWSIAEGSCTDAVDPELASCKPADLHYQQDEEEDSDDTTLLAMPQRPTRRAAAPRRSGEAAVRSSDATSLFQVEEVISGPVVGLVKPEGRDHEQALSDPRPLQTPTAGPSGLAAIYVDMGEEKTRPETWFLVATVALVLVVLLAWACLFQNGKESAQGLAFNPELGRQVMRLPIRSAEEILQKFAPASPAAADSNQNSGMLVRLEGRVVAKGPQIMGTPFSERQCVMYSASASHKRQDGVHQPPLAYHAACSDFTLELEHPEGPLQITVHGHDVLLFEMSQGRFSREAPFSEVPEAWRGFALAHLIHGADASCNAMSCVDLGTKGALEFCESALLDGSRVTCVGEVVRDRNGSLSLCPWRPPVVGLDSPQQPRSRVQSFTAAFFGKPRFSTTTWESSGRSTSALAGQVLISDGADFIDNNFSLWRRLTRGPNWRSASLLVS